MESITEECARILTKRYEEQIFQCTQPGVQILAECGVRRMLEAIRCGAVNALDNESSKDEIVQQLLDNITTVDGKQGILAIKHKPIEVADKSLKWNEAAVYKKPAIVTEDEEYFHGEETRPEKYGYRLGTSAEAVKFGMKPALKRMPSRFAVQTSRSLLRSPTHTRARTPEDGDQSHSHALKRAQTELKTQFLSKTHVASPPQGENTPAKERNIVAVGPLPSIGSWSPKSEETRMNKMEQLLESMQRNMNLLSAQMEIFGLLHHQLASLQMVR